MILDSTVVTSSLELGILAATSVAVGALIVPAVNWVKKLIHPDESAFIPEELTEDEVNEYARNMAEDIANYRATVMGWCLPRLTGSKIFAGEPQNQGTLGKPVVVNNHCTLIDVFDTNGTCGFTCHFDWQKRKVTISYISSRTISTEVVGKTKTFSFKNRDCTYAISKWVEGIESELLNCGDHTFAAESDVAPWLYNHCWQFIDKDIPEDEMAVAQAYGSKTFMVATISELWKLAVDNPKLCNNDSFGTAISSLAVFVALDDDLKTKVREDLMKLPTEGEEN